MIYLKRKSMKRHIVIYKRKKYIKVATAIGSKFYRILVVICLLFSCIAINAKTIRVFTGNIQRVEKIVRIDGNTYFLTLKDGTMYQLEDGKQYSIVLENWKYQEAHYQKAYTLEKIKNLIERAGLRYLTAYDAYTRDVPMYDSERICVIAQEYGK